GSEARILFLADTPSVGFKVFRVVPLVRRAGLQPRGGDSDAQLKLRATASATTSTLENNRLAVKIDANGDISSIVDRDAKRELLRAPIMLELRDNPSPAWPAWEVLYETVQAPAREYVSNPTVKVIERGP